MDSHPTHAIEHGIGTRNGESEAAMNASDTARVQNYLRQRFGNKRLSLARRGNKDDSADLMLELSLIHI